jgi:hypothetical protein
VQDKDQVFHGDDDQQRPENQGEHAEDVGWAGGDGVIAVKAFVESVERAGADVSVDHPEGSQHERPGTRRWSTGILFHDD